MQKETLFWLRILRWGSLYILVTGLLPWFAVFEVTQEPWRMFFDLLRWPIDGNPAGFSDSDRQLSGVLGGVLCGWAWLMYQLANPQVFNSRIRELMVQSAWVWFLLDSSASLFSGIPLNVVGNVGFLLLLIVPLAALKK